MLRISLRLIIQAALCLCLVSFTSQAKTLSKAIEDCTDVDNSLKRLVCFDNVAKTLNGYSEKNQELPVVTVKAAPSSVATVKKENTKQAPQKRTKNDEVENFGKPKPSVTSSYIDGDALIGKVSAVKKLGNKKVIVTLDDGQEWLQTSSEKVGQPKTGDTVVITNGALSSFFMKVEGSKRRIRVKRIN
ncbi:hypothetical protein J3L16_02720 [Alteromonas sp. 5E99-2]|uniref:hypothetical protein n=1 Tax=Alteromonas sp. 5E99-2 TaxID=2817683 RepID=UPI001A98711A|nr:hypothetical protein [Alteromonas sp. 5E99-2]MBO1254597.1 hypothetical protein [Alteromonas sp. 5E99-2]